MGGEVRALNHPLLESHASSSFSELHKLLVLFVAIPVTVATAERSCNRNVNANVDKLFDNH